MTPRHFARLALSLPDVVESEHMGHPDFRAGGRIFATLGAPNDEWGMVKLTPEQQQAFVAAAPDVFQPCVGAWGRQGCTNVRLKSADPETVEEAQRLARENVMAARPKTRKAARPKTGQAARPKTRKAARPKQ